MTASFTGDWLQSLFTFPFRDPRWREKALIAGMVAFAGFFIPVLPWLALYGYFAQVARPIILTGAEPSLPEWDDWGKLLTDGLRLLGAAFVFTLPLIVLFIAGYAGMIGPAIAAGVLEESGRVADTVPMLIAVLGTFGGMALFGLAALLGLVAGVFLPAALMHAVAHEQFAAAFRFGEWWPIFHTNWSGFLLSFALLMGLSFVVSFAMQFLYLTIVLCCLVPFVLAAFSAYSTVIAAALFAQAYRAGAQKVNA